MLVTLTNQRHLAPGFLNNGIFVVSQHSHHTFLILHNFPPTPLTYTNSISN